MILDLIRAELSKLRRPMVVWISALAVFLSVVSVSVFVYVAHEDFDNVNNWFAVLRKGPTSEVCELLNDGSGRSCITLLSIGMRNAEQWLSHTEEAFQLRGAIGSPLGAGGLAAGFTASLPGILALALLAAGHVAGEWFRGTSASRFSRDPRPNIFILAKFLSLALVGVFILVIVAVGLAIIGPILVRVAGLPPAQPGFDPVAFTIEQVPRGLFVIGVTAALGTAAGVIVRRAVGTVGVLVALLGASVVAAMSPTASRWSLASWISEVMRFEQTNYLADHIWITELPAPVSGSRSFLLQCLLAIGCIMLAHARMRYSALDT